MKISLSIRDAVVDQMRSVASAAGVSDSSVAEIALRRLFGEHSQEEITMTVLQEGASARRHTRKTWIEALYASLRGMIPEEFRGGSSGCEFMHYDVMAASERDKEPDRILIHTMEANLPTNVATSYNGSIFSATLDMSPAETAKTILAWLRSQRENAG